MPGSTDRNLLFGILALQMDFISRDALIAAMNAWVLEKTKPLGQILVEQGHLNPQHLALLEPLVQAHIESHHNDPQHSLAALSSVSSVRQELAGVADDDLQASLSRVGSAGLSAAHLARIEEVCDRFEAAWRTAASIGQRPRMEDYMGDSAAPEHAILLCELAVLDIAYRRLAGEQPSVAEYRARFPNLDAARLARLLPRQGPAEPDATIDDHPSRTGPGLRYRILRPHARGGLGEVFVAEDQELHREVALKEIKEDRAHDAVSRSRFLLEAEITGGLEHPGIVPVYGLGQYSDGRPFYAMRFIKGDNLKQAIRRFHEAEQPGRDPGERSLALRQLLRRFVDVCNAVAYAHHRGVLHRDLKPGNIMVGKYGETLIVDWGVAKCITRSELTRTTEEMTLRPTSASDVVATAAGTALGTPAYMSPEQAAGRLDQLGPASDIYSLGATLYALLTGKAPFEESDQGELLQQVQHGAWLPPRQVKTNTAAALDAICRKAMALQSQDRYPTALALAADVEHWLADEPMAAYREPWIGRLRRWGRRHRAVVAAAGALLLTAVVALSVSTVIIRQREQAAQTAREEAEQERDRADRNLRLAREAVDKTVNKITADRRLKEADFHQLRHDLLEYMVPFYQEFVKQRANDPELEAERGRAWGSLASLRDEMGEKEGALSNYEQMRAIFVQLAAEFPEVPQYRQELAGSHNNLGGVLRDLGKSGEAEAAYREALKVEVQLAADFPTVPAYRRDLALSHSNLGALLDEMGKRDEAEAAYREALKVEVQLAADFPTVPAYRRDLALSHFKLGVMLRRLARRDEAEAAYREALKVQVQLAADFPTVPEYRRYLAKTRNSLGLLLRDLGKGAEAEAAFREALKVEVQLAQDFPTVPEYRREQAGTHYNLGLQLRDLGKHGEAEGAFRDALKIQVQLAADFPTVPAYRRDLAWSHSDLGLLLRDLGKGAEAEAAFRDALKTQAQLATDFPTMPDYRNALANTMGKMADLLRDRKDLRAARQLLEEAMPHHKAALQANPRTWVYRKFFRNNLHKLAEILVGLGEHAAAADTGAQLIQAAVDPASDVYNAACIFALCVPLAERDSQLPEAQRMARAQTYADRAMATLQQAVQNGFKDAAHMKQDKDLDPLRSREDFQKMLAALEAKAEHNDK